MTQRIAIDVGASPHLWSQMDAQRRKAGGWWKDMNTLRIRLGDTVLDQSNFTVIEVSVRLGEVQGVRVLQKGVHGVRLSRGPFLLWDQTQFVQWLSAEEPQQGLATLTTEVWQAPDQWLGLQQGLFEVLRAFIA